MQPPAFTVFSLNPGRKDRAILNEKPRVSKPHPLHSESLLSLSPHGNVTKHVLLMLDARTVGKGEEVCQNALFENHAFSIFYPLPRGNKRKKKRKRKRRLRFHKHLFLLGLAQKPWKVPDMSLGGSPPLLRGKHFLHMLAVETSALPWSS